MQPAGPQQLRYPRKLLNVDYPPVKKKKKREGLRSLTKEQRRIDVSAAAVFKFPDGLIISLLNYTGSDFPLSTRLTALRCLILYSCEVTGGVSLSFKRLRRSKKRCFLLVVFILLVFLFLFCV